MKRDKISIILIVIVFIGSLFLVSQYVKLNKIIISTEKVSCVDGNYNVIENLSCTREVTAFSKLPLIEQEMYSISILTAGVSLIILFVSLVFYFDNRR